MAAARADRGPAVRVVRARQVKAGVRGLLGQATYEVVVDPASGRAPRSAAPSARPSAAPRRPAPAPAPKPRRRRSDDESGDTVASTLEALLEAAEAEEREQPVVVADPPDPVPVGDPTIDDLLADMAARSETPRPPSAGRVSNRAARPRRRTHPDLDISDHEPSALVEADPVPLREPQPAVLELEAGPARPRGRSAGRVTRAKLRALGIPTTILKRLPSEEPDSPGGWLDALHEVVSVVVPPPAEVSATHPVVISGYGLAGVLAMLEAGAAGIPPGMLTVDGVTAPATAGRMIEVVRACVHS